MAPVAHKEYFYQWPYTAFGDTFENVLILGAGSGTDVAAALAHGARHVDAVEIDPTIIRLGRQLHPDHPYDDPRVTVINDDARHFLRTTRKKYDLVVFALIDSLTMQSSFSGVRLESYMFTEESFRARPRSARARRSAGRLQLLPREVAGGPAGQYCGERPSTSEPRVHVHEARAYLGVILAGPRLATLTSDPVVPDRVAAYNQSHAPSPARIHVRDRLSNRRPTTGRSSISTRDTCPGTTSPRWRSFSPSRPEPCSGRCAGSVALGPGSSSSSAQDSCCSRRRRSSSSRCCGDRPGWWRRWRLPRVLSMALAANFIVSRMEIRRRWLVGAVLIGLLALNVLIPVGRVTFESRAAESMFYAVLMFSPILCAGLLFGSAIKRSTSLPARFRHQPPRRDGRRRRRIPLPRYWIQPLAGSRGGFLHRRARLGAKSHLSRMRRLERVARARCTSIEHVARGT